MDKELLDMFANASSAQEQQQEQPQPVKYTQDYRIQKHNDFYQIMAENIRISEKQRVEIIKGLQQENVQLEELFLIALDCISKMTKNEHFYKYTTSIIKERKLFDHDDRQP